MVKIAVLDCATFFGTTLEKYVSTGKLVMDWLSPHLPDVKIDTFAIAHGEAFPDKNDYAGFILPGSEFGVYDDPPWMISLRDYLLTIKDSRKPLLGICFGHQMMAHTFGGRAAKAGYGMCVGPRCWTHGDETFNGQVFHQDQVIEVPPGAQVIGGADYCPNGIIAYDFPALSIQFHPEYKPELINDVIDFLEGEILTDDQAKSSREALQREVRADLFGKQAAEFFGKHL